MEMAAGGDAVDLVQSKLTAPRARLAAKIAEVALVGSVRIRPNSRATGAGRVTSQLKCHLPADFAGIEMASIAGIFHVRPCP